LPLQELAEPRKLLFLALAQGRLFLVPPVGSDTLLGEPVHLLGAKLELHALSLGPDDRRMERLVEVGLGTPMKSLNLPGTGVQSEWIRPRMA